MQVIKIKLPNIKIFFLLMPLLLTEVNALESPVADAAKNGDIVLIKQLLKGGVEVNEPQGDGMTALHWAAERGNIELAEVLIYAGANPMAGTRIGQYKPLHLAAKKGNAGIIKILLDAGIDPNIKTANSGSTALHLASASGDTESVTSLLLAGAQVNGRENAWGQTPLIFAAAANHVGVMHALLDAGADPELPSNIVDVIEMEKADQSAEKRINEIIAQFKEKEAGGTDWLPTAKQVQAAIESGREIQRNWSAIQKVKEDKENTALDTGEEFQQSVAIRQPDLPTVLTYNADGEPVYELNPETGGEKKDLRQSYGQMVGKWGGLTPLLHAIRQGHKEAVDLLLDSNVDINQPSGDGTTPLLMAAINGQFDLAMKLIKKGANPNMVSDAGTSPLFAVLERKWAPKASYAHPIEHQQQQATHLDLIRALLKSGADPNIRMNQHLWYTEYTFFIMSSGGIHFAGATPFWRATQALDLEAMRLLKKYGANPDIANTKRPKRRRPMDQAADPEEQIKEEIDHSGLPLIPDGGPSIYPIHLASGAGYGQYFVGTAHQHVPGNWLPVVKFLVEECAADVNLRDANGYTPLHHAASRGDNKVIRYLLEKGADVMAVSRKGQTTVDMANGPIERVIPYRKTIDLLEQLGAKNNNNCMSC